MPRPLKSWLWIGVIDVLLLIVSFLIAFAFMVGWPPPVSNFHSFIVVAPMVFIAALMIYFGFGLYVNRIRLGELHRMLFISEGVLFTATLALAFWLRGFAFPRSVLLLAFVVHLLAMACWRTALWIVRQQGVGPKKVVIAANHYYARNIVRKFINEPQGWFELMYVATPKEVISNGPNCLENIDLLVIGPSVLRSERNELLRQAIKARTAVQVIPDLGDVLLAGSIQSQVDDLSVLEVRPLELSTGQLVAKRVFDLVLSVPLLFVATPLLVCIWSLIKVASPGPAIFGQERVGKNNELFTLFKFRTMVLDAEKTTGPVLAIVNDPRITPLGRFLRASRLDELPQLVNVIRGEMSLVGPRPERVFFVDNHSRDLPDYPLRHVVAPGITGWAQVMGKYGTSAANKLSFDLLYIRHYSIWLDLQVLLLTVRTMILRTGAGLSGTERSEVAVAKESDLLNRAFEDTSISNKTVLRE